MNEPNVNYENVPEDVVNKPSHYHKNGLDVIALLELKYDSSVLRGFCIGNVLKYTIRYQHKNGVQDLEKAEFYLKKLIEMEKVHEV